ncbi:MAG: PDZ domain-containing protein, partial [Thermoproteota archaeon]
AIIPFAHGIGFAIPINAVKEVVREIMLYGSYAKPWLGIAGISLSRQIAMYYDLPVEHGVLVANIVPGSPAHRAGVERGDIIVEFDGKRIDKIEDLQEILSKRTPGCECEVAVVRNLRKFRAKVTVGKEP